MNLQPLRELPRQLPIMLCDFHWDLDTVLGLLRPGRETFYREIRIHRKTKAETKLCLTSENTPVARSLAGPSMPGWGAFALARVSGLRRSRETAAHQQGDFAAGPVSRLRGPLWWGRCVYLGKRRC